MNIEQILEKMINEVLDDFDFEKVHAVMTLLNRRWFVLSKATSVVPTVEMLRERARYLLENVAIYFGDDKPHFISSGGLNVILVKYSLTLQYILTEAGIEYEPKKNK